MADMADQVFSGTYCFVDSSGVHHRSPPGAGESLTAQVVAAQNDYLECKIYDEVSATAGVTIFVAKPWMLRRTPFHGATITYLNGQSITYTYVSQRERTANDGATSETQVMTPDYYVGEVIDVIEKRTNVALPDGSKATLQDRNTCGRFWAQEAA